ncbi:MAG: 16S rRNA (uracil(1498)-N(3))-methyltransferase [Tissierellales bacterium]|jgi:16S rRNA (uracil1498-N3)-methyltransferase|nr:16S rRNA (uracil(1498)-N(3))-methyltransferase [Tissierellales bacterium]
MRKFFVSSDQIDGQKIFLEEESYKHMIQVLRMEIGDEMWISDGESMEYFCSIESIDIDEKTLILAISETREFSVESPLDICLCQGLPKSDKMDMIVQKNTELGINTIIPLAMERSIVKLDAKKSAKKCDRWQKIAQEAAKQSKRNKIPTIESVRKLPELLKTIEDGIILVPYEDEKKQTLKETLKSLDRNKKIYIVIGPEGGFEESEIDMLRNHGAKILSLGPRILRTETAGLMIHSILQYELGDVGESKS